MRTRIFGLLTLASLLMVVYTLSSSGRFHIVDEVSMYAVTESAALQRTVDTNAIAWTQWVNSPGEVLGAFGPDGQVYSKKGPALSFAALPWYLILHFITQLNVKVGQLQGTLLFNGFLTAWTAALVWLAARRLGYRDRTGMQLGLFFGLATIAWPYAKQFFGEPLSSLSLLVTFYGMLAWRQNGRWWWLLAAGIGAGVALATVTAHALLLAILIGWFIVDWFVRRRPFGVGKFALGLAGLAAPVVIAGALLMLYNQARFGSPLSTGYHFDTGEGFTTPIWQGLWGLLFSPYRSIFLHTPLFIASVAAFVPFVRRHRSPGILIGLLSAALILLYSAWWMWWGGFAWGPRFLVPLTPFWILLLAPALEPDLPANATADHSSARSRRPTVLGWITYGLAGVSFVVQLAAVSMNFVNYEILLRGMYPTDWADPLAFGPPAQSFADLLNSPVAGQFRLMLQDFIGNTDLAWLWADGTVLWLVAVIGLAALATLIALLVLWWRADSDRRQHITISTPTFLLVMALPLMVMAAWIGEIGRDPIYGTPDKGYRGIIADLCRDATATDVFVNVAPTAYQIPMNWMPGACRVAAPTYGYAMDSTKHTETGQVLENLLAKHDRIWFVTSGVQPNDPDNQVERWLSDHSYKATDSWYDDYRLVQYATGLRLNDIPPKEINKALLGKNAEQVTIVSARAPSVAPVGKPIPIEITYRLEAPTDQKLRWFIQLLSGRNIPLAQLDSGPNDNYTTFSDLPARQDLTERAGVLVPANTPPGEYRLIAGLYNPDADGARLITVGGPDWVELGNVRIVGGQ